jgi:hypothetical protein
MLQTKVPLPAQDYVRLEPAYTMLAGGGATSELLARALIVYDGSLVPRVGPEHSVSALRIDVPLRYAHTSMARATGLGDLELLALTGVAYGWGSIGSGLASILPTTTSSALDAGELSVGPACYGYLGAIPHVPIALVARTLFATGVASQRAPAIETILEPTVTVEINDEVSLSSNAYIELDWLTHDATVPVNLRVGHSFGKQWYIEAGPEIVVVGTSRGDVTYDLEVDYLP